jgi:hypothetical protein
MSHIITRKIRLKDKVHRQGRALKFELRPHLNVLASLNIMKGVDKLPLRILNYF